MGWKKNLPKKKKKEKTVLSLEYLVKFWLDIYMHIEWI